MYIKDKFTDKFKGTECEEMEIGYIMPRRGWKGKIMWISDDEDVNQMYSEYSTIKRGNINIHLWCHLPASKPQTSSKKRQASSGQPATKRAKCAENNEDKMNEAGTIYKELMKKHEKYYTVEQLHAWAQLMQIKKHGSLDDPPDYPFLRAERKQHKYNVIHQLMLRPKNPPMQEIQRLLRPMTPLMLEIQCLLRPMTPIVLLPFPLQRRLPREESVSSNYRG